MLETPIISSMFDPRGKSILLLGSGAHALEAAQYLHLKGAQLLLWGEPLDRERFEAAEKSLKEKIKVHFADTPPPDFSTPDLILCAEPKEKKRDFIEIWRAQGALIRTLLELACELSAAKIAAITGTNGKSSTLKMIEKMLQQSKLPYALAGGSFGSFFSALPAAQKAKVFLLEVNSHQLAEAEVFHPAISVMTNLAKAHKDRHGKSTQYALAKAKIFAHQVKGDFLIYNADNDPLYRLAQEASCERIPVFLSGVPNPFQEARPEGPQVYFSEKRFYFIQPNGSREEYPTEKIPLRAQHQFENAMEALACARLLGANPAAVQEVLNTYTGLPHRMQKINTTRGVDWYDDSRASNPAATAWGIWGFSKKVILITGGRETYAKYKPMEGTVKERVKILILVGQSRRRMDAQLNDLTETFLVKTLEEAVRLAYARAEKEDVVIYSPACPPEPGLFTSMEHRGKLFSELIEKEVKGDVREKMSRIRRLPGQPI